MTQLATAPRAVADDKLIRPFRVNIPEAALVNLRRRIAATRWPERETVDDFSQGVQLAKLKPLVQYWGTKHEWRKAEARLNALPNFVTTIDDLDIHFIHVRSRHPNAMPLLMTHGWPGSVFELLKVVDPLTNPTAFGGREEDAFHLVMPSYPGYGFSEKPKKAAGWGPDHVRRAFHQLMLRLGYNRYVSQGSEWGAIISEVQGGGGPFNAFDIPNVPVAVTIFPGEIYRAPRSWGEQAFKKLIYWNEVDKGGHFAAWEQPQLFAEEIRAAFRSLR